MRFGLVGTGPWAQQAHGPGLAGATDVELVGVWGRDPTRSAPLARDLGVAAYDDFEALLHDVEAVAFAVPPAVQARMATTAARAGKHVLLDKPVADDAAAARALVEAIEAAQVASMVFFTDRFAPATRAWLTQVGAAGGWRGAWGRWLTTLDAPDNPFGASPWRHERGALWDLGPHVLSTLSAALGPIESVRATGGPRDLVVLALRHRGGATSSVTLSAFAPPAAAGHELVLWGEAGLSPMPSRVDESVATLVAVAAGDLVSAARTGAPHPLDARFGAHVVDLLADAQAQLDGQP